MAISAPVIAAPLCVPGEFKSLFAGLASPHKLPVNVYLDGSQSMSGFAQKSDNPVKALADLLRIVADKSQRDGTKVSYFAFGKSVTPIAAGRASTYATPVPYNCTGCDNQESHIDDVLRAALEQPPASLTLIVTDLWLDNKSFYGSSQVALGGPLKDLLASGRAVGVVGVSAPFRGKVYDLPGYGSYQLDGEKPLIVLAIGPEADVSAFVSAMRKSGSPAFSDANLKYTLFSRPTSSRLASAPSPAGGGVKVLPALDGLPQLKHYSFDTSLAGKPGQNGKIAGRYSVAESVRPGAMWKGKPAAKTRVWALSDPDDLAKCGPQTWTEVKPLPGSWKGGPQGTGDFALNSASAKSLIGGRTYLVAGTLGTAGLQVPGPASDWMREWSLAPAQTGEFLATKPKRFKTLNLADIAGLLEQGVVDVSGKQQMRVGFAFAVSVE